MQTNAVLGRDRRKRIFHFKSNRKFIFWNAGGFILEQQVEFDHLIYKREDEAFTVCEEGTVSEHDKFGDFDYMDI
jgi:hypothetical protein